jgi:plasmid stability protein
MHGAINAYMAQLIVRNIDESVVRALKLRAAQKGRSAEAEHRELLRTALLGHPTKSFKEVLRSMPPVGTDADFERSRSRVRRVKL